MEICFGLQEYSEWKKEATDISLPGVYIGLMDCLNSFSRVIVDSTQELCAMLVSSYMEKVKETCKNGKKNKAHMMLLKITLQHELTDVQMVVCLGVLTLVKNFKCVCNSFRAQVRRGG